MKHLFAAAAGFALVLSVVAAVGTPASGGEDGGTVYVLDVSRSHGPAADLLLERLRLSHASSPGAGKARVILVGATALDLGAAESGAWPVLDRARLPRGMENGSRVDLGLALARRTIGRAERVVVLTDGRFDHGPVAHEQAALARAGVTASFGGPLAQPALDFRMVPRAAATAEGGRARVRAAVAGTNREPRSVAIIASGGPGEPSRSAITVMPGAVLEWEALVPAGPDARSVSLRVVPDGGPDAAQENDAIEVPIAREASQALVVAAPSKPERAAVVDVLRSAAFSVAEASSLASLDTAALGAADLVVLIDQSVTGLPRGVLGAIERAVTDGGTGLWVIGGPDAFQLGGYAASTRFDDLLPLSSRLTAPRRVTVLLDASGSMEQDGRLRRAVDAIAQAVQALSPQDVVQAIPFAQQPLPAIPVAAAPPESFLATALPDLRRVPPRGGTRLIPALDALLATPPKTGVRDVAVLVTDARDDEATPDLLAVRRSRIVDAKVDLAVILLDPDAATRGRAAAIATAGVAEAADVTPRLLLDAVARDAFVTGPVATVLPDASVGPRGAWFNRVREGTGARVALATPAREPLMASAFRGAGRTAAWAVWPVDPKQTADLAREWASQTARPAGWKRASARREPGRIVITLPPGTVPDAPLAVRHGPAGESFPMAERKPGVFDVPSDLAPQGGHLTVLDGDSLLATVPVPPAGDPEYAWPAVLPPGGPEGAAAASRRLRGPWAVLAALAWAAAVLLRRRP